MSALQLKEEADSKTNIGQRISVLTITGADRDVLIKTLVKELTSEE
jgi:hypothetical protein